LVVVIAAAVAGRGENYEQSTVRQA
jgi:hypothetical protein